MTCSPITSTGHLTGQLTSKSKEMLPSQTTGEEVFKKKALGKLGNNWFIKAKKREVKEKVEKVRSCCSEFRLGVTKDLEGQPIYFVKYFLIFNFRYFRLYYEILCFIKKWRTWGDNAMPKWMTVRQIAEYLQMSDDKIYDMAQKENSPVQRCAFNGDLTRMKLIYG